MVEVWRTSIVNGISFWVEVVQVPLMVKISSLLVEISITQFNLVKYFLEQGPYPNNLKLE